MPVIDAFKLHSKHGYNLSSPHSFGRAAYKLYDASVTDIKKMLHASRYTLLSCSSATEANHWCIHSMLQHYNTPPHVIASAIEHPCVLEPLHDLANAKKINLSICPVNQHGILDCTAFNELLQPTTAFISIMHANNELGSIQPIKTIVERAKTVGAIVHCDMSQSIGKIPVNCDDIDCDMITMSGHKCYSPPGWGGLLIKDPEWLTPIFKGGGQQQRRRAGTVNVLGAHLFSIGLNYCIKNMGNHVDFSAWMTLLKTTFPTLHVVTAPTMSSTLWNTACIGIPNTLGETTMMAFDLNGIAIATGSACSTGAIDLSPTISALNLPIDTAKTLIRISIGYPTTNDDLSRLMTTLKKYKLPH